MTVPEHIARLKLQAVSPCTEAELAEIERLSGLKLTAVFRDLWRAVGGCVVGAKIREGQQAGQDVCEFWAARIILEKLGEERLARVVPFAEDLWGNWFFIDKSGAVNLVDWNTNRVEPVSRDLDEFLDSLVL